MRISCEFKTELLPLCNSMLFVSLIKEALKKSNKEYYDNTYKYLEEQSNKKSKNFSFALYMKNFTIIGEEIQIKGGIVLNITSPDPEFMIYLYNGLLKIKDFKYKNYILSKVKVNKIKEKKVNSEEVVFKTLSPLCIKRKDGKFIDFTEDSFTKELNYVCDKILKNYRGFGLKRDLHFKNINLKKVVVKQKISDFTRETGKEIYYVNAFRGMFYLTGDKKDLNDLHMLGIGFKRNQGFGMMEIMN